MGLDYLLTVGIVVVGFVALVIALMQALAGSMAIKTYLFSLPVG